MGGHTEVGGVMVAKITRGLSREQLIGQSSDGSDIGERFEFAWALQPLGSPHARGYTPTGEPVLFPTEWRIALGPTGDRWVPPTPDP